MGRSEKIVATGKFSWEIWIHSTIKVQQEAPCSWGFAASFWLLLRFFFYEKKDKSGYFSSF